MPRDPRAPLSLELERQVAFWREELAGVPATLELPTDRPRPTIPAFAAGTAERTADIVHADALRALAHREATNLFVVLLAGLQAVLCRYTNQDDILVGVPLHARNPDAAAPRLAATSGDVVAVRARLSADPSFRDLLHQVGQTAKTARDHGAVSFTDLVDALPWPCEPGHAPVVQVLFELKTCHTEPRARSLRALTPVETDLPPAVCDLVVSVEETCAGLVSRIDYNRDIFEESTVARLLTHWEVLLRGAAKSPDLRVSGLPLLTAAERRRIVVDWNETALDLPQDVCVHELFEAQVRRTPDALAVAFDGRSLTYREMDRRANQLAHHLGGLGVGPETIVGICVERSLELVVGILGILKAGAAYLPLDPCYPKDRLTFMLDDSGAAVLLTQACLLPRLPSCAAAVTCLDADSPRIGGRSEEAPSRRACPRNLAYVIYTSGSTGRPKGVAIEHHSVVAMITWAVTVFSAEELKGTLFSTSVCFDLSIYEMFVPLSRGGKVIIAQNALFLPTLIEADEVTLLNAVPTVVAELLRTKGIPASVRTVNVAGEPLLNTLAQQIYAVPTVERVYNLYGPTEDTTYSTCTLVNKGSASAVTIGKVISNSQAYILDAHMQPVPIGVSGELFLGGEGLARGYLNRPELTTERFIKNPFSDDPSARVYRTGDLARWRANGDIEFLGRIDHQVKIRGVRVELGEVEAALREHPAVLDAAALVREDTPGDHRLVAYVVPELSQAASADDARALIPTLHAFLRHKLPSPMIPSAFVEIEALPRNRNGKIDRRALPAPRDLDAAPRHDGVAPRSGIEEALASIWRDVLHRDRVGIHDDFLELGGHSLHAVQLFSRIRQVFGTEMNFQTFFARSTIAEVAAHLKGTADAATKQKDVIPATPRGGHMPLSFAQERLWFLHRLAPKSTAYNCPFFFRLIGCVDVPALDRSLLELVRRHEALRTTFLEIEGKPVQVITEEASCHLERVDLQHLSPVEREEDARRRLAAEAEQPFDLGDGPLFRAKLLRLGPEDHLLALHFHHIVIDGWAVEVALRELAKLYESFCRGTASPLPDLPIQYADYATWQRQHTEEDAVELLAWWKQKLAGVPPLLELPGDHLRPAVQSFRGSALPFRLDASLTGALKQLSVRKGMTLSMVLLAAFATVIHRYTRRTDIVIGFPSANRERVEVERVIGFFVNTLPMRLDLSGDPSFEILLDRVRLAAIEVYDRDGLPFERLVQELRPERKLSYNPVVQIGYAPQPPGEHDLMLPGVSVEYVAADAKKTVLDLTLYTWDRPGGTSGIIEYSTDLFERSTIERLLAHLVALLDGVVANSDQRVSELPLLTAAERHQVLVEWNDTAADLPQDVLVHELFEAQVERTPDAVAVVFEDSSLTYRGLDRRANQLAHHLRDLGVEPEAIVGICVERSLDMVVGILGILKAGGAYLPLDADYPGDRLAFMLDDSRAPVLLTQARLRPRLPACTAAIVRLDADATRIEARSEEALPRRAGPRNLAYVIYTSGSTGRPKGVLVEHRNAVHLTEAMRRSFGVRGGSRVLQLASPSFDASVADLFSTLTVGATLCLAPPRTSLSGLEVGHTLRRLRISNAIIPPSVLAQQPFEPLPELTTLIVAGEPCSAELVDRWAPGRRFINAYGPTEGTVCATLTDCLPGHGAPPIGRPIANVRVFVLDPHGQLVPAGVPGELYIGGAGVARGYLDRPELTLDRFLPDPFSGHPGARLYRTGDLVRWRADGDVEFLGRIDQQIKLRGFRIELGEIEAALRGHLAVLDAAVLAREDTPGDKRLVAYILPDPVQAASSDHDPALQAEHVAEWRRLYEEVSQEPAGGDPTFNVTGWTSSYTGEAVADDAMRAWRDQTVKRLLALRAHRIWEIGCGAGLLLLQVAPHCTAYLGTDLSASTIASLGRQLPALRLAQVALDCREANDFSGIAAQSFDAAVLSSVIQYFPDAQYLRVVLDGALRSVAHGGVLFIGDVRSLPLLEAFHASVEVFRASPDLPVAWVRGRVQRALSMERELVVAPDYFRALCHELPALTHAEIWLKRGRSSDEMTRFRYDVLLHVGRVPEPVSLTASLTWTAAGPDLASLERWLLDTSPDAAEVLGIPNARVCADVLVTQRLQQADGTIGDLTSRAAADTAEAVDPEAIWELGERLGYAVRVTWSRTADPSLVDVLFERPDASARPRAWTSALTPQRTCVPHHTNDPLRGRRARVLIPTLRAFLQQRLPDHMLPSAFVELDALPLTPSGKIDRGALPAPERNKTALENAFVAPRFDIEEILAGIWRRVLDLDRVGIDDAFFDLGGHSLLLAQVRAAISERLGRQVPMVDLFQHPTIRRLASYIGSESETRVNESKHSEATAKRPAALSGAIAVIGMAGRFPGAGDIEQLWSNLRDGVEGISFFTPEELDEAGLDPTLSRSPQFVPACGVLEEATCFDAAFFGYSPKDAELMDPQQRVFLECAWESLENAGYDPVTYPDAIGVFGGADVPYYWLERVGLRGGPLSAEEYQSSLGNVTDNLTTRVAYKLGLRGPAMTILSACSTSLVAVHVACQSLRANECDMALAGGVAFRSPSRLGHLYEDGSIASPDGHCRPFDAEARGIVGGSGVALVVLKRLEEALADGDTIHAIIRGSAVNNDGASKIGFTAPGLSGQADVIARAHAAASVAPEAITYVEAHGTATPLGDPIEVAALTQAFRRKTDKRRFCALGSVKSSIGHLGAAAGVAGLIKAVLSLERELIPPTLHFRRENPEIDFADSPFFVNAGPLAWRRGERPRCAGVSALGVGGTNVHVVLEEAPEVEPSGPSRSAQLLLLSAQTDAALEAATDRLADHMTRNPAAPLPDIAFTLQRGRAVFAHRRVAVCRDSAAAVEGLQARDNACVFQNVTRSRPPKVVFMFPGGGTQQVDMGRTLYLRERVYRESFDQCAALFSAELSADLGTTLFPEEGARAEAAERLLRPTLNLATIFATEYALAQLLLAWGIEPAAITGHSLGEYVGACVAGVLSVGDAVALVALRGRIYEELPDRGATLIVPLSEAALSRYLSKDLSLAALNGPDLCVVSGPAGAIDDLEVELRREAIEVRRLPISTAAHSRMVEPFMDRLTLRAAAMELRAPRRRIVSNLTGRWMEDTDAQDPSYWARHLRGTIRFADGLALLLADPDHVLVEVGPGRTLATLARRHPAARPERLVATTMAGPGSDLTDVEALLSGVGQLWCAGVDVDWTAFSRDERRHRVPLPTYPFERIPYLHDATPAARSNTALRTDRANGTSAKVRSAPFRSPSHGAAVPVDPVTQTLADLGWELLGVRSVRPADNFFDLGGTSLAAVQLRAGILERLNIALPVHALVESPTFAALGDRIRRARPQETTMTSDGQPAQANGRHIESNGNTPDVCRLSVQLDAGASGRPHLFLIQPIGGTVYTYLPFSRSLDAGFPVHGIRASGMEPGEPVLTEITAMAARYVEELKSIQPEGPYLLGGHSAGGVIAYEMAQQILRSGEDVPLLLMLDTPSTAVARSSSISCVEDILREVLAFRAANSDGYRGFVAALQEDSAFREIVMSTWGALAAYEPSAIRADVLYIRAQEQIAGQEVHHERYWMDRAERSFSFHNVPGDHFTMMDRPHVADIARIVRRHLAMLVRDPLSEGSLRLLRNTRSG